LINTCKYFNQIGIISISFPMKDNLEIKSKNRDSDRPNPEDFLRSKAGHIDINMMKAENRSEISAF